MLTTITRTAAAASVAAVAAATLVAAPAQAAINDPTASGVRWLSAQLSEGLAPSSYGGSDYGLSIDVYVALKTLGVRTATQKSIITALTSHVADYTTGGSYDAVNSRYAGATGKLTTAVALAGEDTTAFGGVNLKTTLEGTVQSSGRATDTSDYGDYSNAVGQGWVVRGLAGSGSTKLAAATDYLLKQQCANGEFRSNMEATGTVGATCDDGVGNVLSVDATALAIPALLAAKSAGVAGLDDDIADAATALIAHQGADGGVGDAADKVNANSTGLAATSLLSVGKTDAAAKAATWLAAHQVTDALADGTALESEVGAVAYNDAALTTGKTAGIADAATRGTWLRSSAQAVPGLAALIPASPSPTPSTTTPATPGTKLPAATLGVVPSGKTVPAGAPLLVTVKGLAPSEATTATVDGGKPVSTTAAADGSASLAIVLPAGTASRTITVTGFQADRVGTATVRVLGSTKPTVKLRRTTVSRRVSQTISVSGLDAGEQVSLFVNGNRLKRGVASSTGTWSTTVKLGRLGTKRVTIRGAFASRQRTLYYRVVR